MTALEDFEASLADCPGCGVVRTVGGVRCWYCELDADDDPHDTWAEHRMER